MFLVDWDEGKGWHDPRIVPYGPLNLGPAAMVLHYGQEIFEGLKAFTHPDGSVHLFRPDRNAARLNTSAKRMSMPEIPVELQLEAMRKLIRIDSGWVPPPPATLYVRPTMIATQEALGVHSSKRFLYFIITGPTGPYFGTSTSAVRIMVARDWVRAAPGGTGAAKTGGNYAASLVASAVAKEKGCDQVMWLDAVERRHVEEVGAMNLMFVFDGVVTTPPTSGTILAGITRESLGVLCKELRLPFVERSIHIEEVFQGLAKRGLHRDFRLRDRGGGLPRRRALGRRQGLPRRRRQRGPGGEEAARDAHLHPVRHREGHPRLDGEDLAARLASGRPTGSQSLPRRRA